MQKLLIKIAQGLALITFLSSCGNFKSVDVLQCSPFFSYEQLPDGRPIIDVEQSVCFCRKYHYSKEFIGPISEVQDHPIDFCNKIVGPPAEDYTALATYLEAVRRQLNGK